MELAFPYEKIRPVQKDLIAALQKALATRTHLLAHAPTGLGKTIAALYVTLPYALEKDLTIFFLTSKHTQHKIAIETLRELKEKNKVQFTVADMIGKKWMCLQPKIEQMSSGDFAEFCKHMVEHKTCEFYVNARKENKPTAQTIVAVESLSSLLAHTEEIIHEAREEKLCPYELAVELAKKASVIIGDYYYVFNPYIQEAFFRKIGKELGKCIIIVDEAHNLPSRIRELATSQLSVLTLKRAIIEAKKFHYNETISVLSQLNDILLKLGRNLKTREERLVKKEQFMHAVESIDSYEKIVDDLIHLSEVVKDMQRQSALGSVAQFLASWKGQDEGFARILSVKEIKKEPVITLTYHCLYPGTLSKATIDNSYCTVFMSGTLTPTFMYRDLLGVEEEKCEEVKYESPFPEYNRLNLVVPTVTTKFTMRNSQQYAQIGSVCSEIIEAVPGNSIVFFPSYRLRDTILLLIKTSKKIFLEKPDFTKEERYALVEQFKQHKDSGAVILAVVGGSFGEGIDLPGDYLKGVVVVGLPLEPPDLETKELVKYCQTKFGKGWDYGYLYPAFNRVIQGAGRCIRTETDKGVIVFLDQRYLWPMYRRCFPEEWEIEATKEYVDEIESFFKRK